MVAPTLPASQAGADAFQGGDEIDEGEPDLIDSPDMVTTGTEAIDQVDTAIEPSPVAEHEPERVAPQLATEDPVVREEAPPDGPNEVESGEVESEK